MENSKVSNKSKLAIFDFDGTLFDTGMVNYLAYNEALKEYGYDINYRYFHNCCNGLDYKTFLPPIIGQNNTLLIDIHDKKKIYYKKYIDKAKINVHLFYIVESLKTLYYTSIVSTASKQNCFDLLCHFKKEHLFDKVFTREDVTKPKPDPQGFFLAMDYFSVKPKNTIIFEDSKVGIEAAGKTQAALLKVETFSEESAITAPTIRKTEPNLTEGLSDTICAF